MHRNSLPEQISLSALVSAPPALPEEVLPGLLAGTVGVLAAPPGAGKSMFMLQLVADIATGANTLGISPGVTPGPALLLAAEDPEFVLSARLHTLLKFLGPGHQEAAMRHLGVIPALATGIDLGSTDAWREVIAERARGCKLLVVDSLSSVRIGSENGAAAVTAIRNLEWIAKSTGAAVVAVHTAGKVGGSGYAASAGGPRQGGGWLEEIKWLAYLSPMGESEAAGLKLSAESRRGSVQFGGLKASYGTAPDPRPFIRRENGLMSPVQPPELKKQDQAERVPAGAVTLPDSDSAPASVKQGLLFLDMLLAESKRREEHPPVLTKPIK